jgi:hypothetical protein
VVGRKEGGKWLDHRQQGCRKEGTP